MPTTEHVSLVTTSSDSVNGAHLSAPNATTDVADAIAQSVRRRKRSTQVQRLTVRLIQVAILVGFLGAWEWASRGGLLNELYFTKPTSVFSYLWDNHTVLLESLKATAIAAIWGYVIGCTLGILVGFLLAAFERVDRVLDPFFTMINSLPRIALAPLMILWFGITLQAKVALAVSLVFFILLVNTRSAAHEVDRDLIRQSKVLGGSGFQRFRTITVPASLPGVFAGLRIAVVYSLFGVVASEMIAARSGLGVLAVTYSQNFNTAGLFAVLMITALLAWVWTGIIVITEHTLVGSRYG